MHATGFQITRIRRPFVSMMPSFCEMVSPRLNLRLMRAKYGQSA